MTTEQATRHMRAAKALCTLVDSLRAAIATDAIGGSDPQLGAGASWEGLLDELHHIGGLLYRIYREVTPPGSDGLHDSPPATRPTTDRRTDTMERYTLKHDSHNRAYIFDAKSPAQGASFKSCALLS